MLNNIHVAYKMYFIVNSARVLAQRETLEAREISLRRALQLASSYENQKCGIQSEETLRSLLAIKDDKICALEKCVKELESRMRRLDFL